MGTVSEEPNGRKERTHATYEALTERLRTLTARHAECERNVTLADQNPVNYPPAVHAAIHKQYNTVHAELEQVTRERNAFLRDPPPHVQENSGTPRETGNGQAPTAFADDGREPENNSKQHSSRSQLQGVYNAATLKHREFPSQPEAVVDLLPLGLALVAGPPKLGKSWFALNVACAVQSGGPALSRFDVNRGDVLYLAFEDSQRRIQNRLLTLFGDYDDWPETLPDITHEVPGGWEKLQSYLTTWLDSHANARLVVIDTLAKIKPTRKRHEDPYQADYAIAGQLQTLAIERGICLLVVHHTKKGPEEDFISSVSGTHGITGACDTVLVLKRKRGEAEGTLSVSGRDIEERDLAMKQINGDWLCMGDTLEVRRSESRQKIINALSQGHTLTPAEVATATGMPRGTVRRLLSSMLAKGELRKEGERYSL